jgi:hypothetical protein
MGEFSKKHRFDYPYKGIVTAFERSKREEQHRLMKRSTIFRTRDFLPLEFHTWPNGHLGVTFCVFLNALLKS